MRVLGFGGLGAITWAITVLGLGLRDFSRFRRERELRG